MSIREWSEKEVGIMKEIYTTTPNTEVVRLLSKPLWEIKKIAGMYNLCKNRDVKENKDNKLMKFINDNTLQKYYWIGFILADGWIRKDGSINIELAEKDKNHLEAFREFCGTTNKLRSHRNNWVYRQNDIVCTRYLKDTFDISPNKTYNQPKTEYFDKLTTSEKIALFIGFIDGDGNIRITKKGCITITLENHASWITFYEYFRDCVYSAFNQKSISKIRTNNRGYIVLNFSKRDIFHSFIKFIKDNNLYVMKRKWREELFYQSVNFYKKDVIILP